MLKYVLTVVFVLLVAFPALALDDTPENRAAEADRYLAVVPPQELFQDISSQMARNLPPDKRQQFIDLMTKHLDLAAVVKNMKDAMTKHFTAEELKAFADFYGSPAGKSGMKKMGAYMAEAMPAITAEIIKAQAKANRELKE
jgi:hypothetical protein